MSDVITVTGNIATVPELRHGPNGLSITTFRVASTERRFDRSANTWIDGQTNWYSVSTFRSLADHAYASLAKGDRVILTGRLRLRQWEAGDRKGLAVEIDADALGHDLRWGTTRYRSARAAGASDVGDSGTAEQWPAPQPGEGADASSAPLAADGGWSVPGADPAPPTVPSDRELVGADADTPF
ncbi:single-stranded DNA-binding protein [Microbacterium sp. CJ88]|uniref:single-stranded DNA-binding protein n=1 Tax=Microbacterium sp. CJ88 TaxID=3445672 RepID=UPI003F65DD92